VPPTPTPGFELDPAPDSQESIELLRRARDGDRAALGLLFARYEDRIRRIVRLRMGPKLRGVLESVDLVQETYLAAARGFDGFQGGERGSVIHWLARIAENQVRDAADRWSRARRDVEREVRLAGPDASSAGGGREPVDRGRSPSEEAARRELREVYDGCVAELPPRYREIVLLRDYELLDWSEIVPLTGGSVHAAQELHRRAQLKLAGLLEARL